LQKAFEAALTADSGALFSDGIIAEGECCEALRQMVEQRPPYELSTEMLSSASHIRLAPGDGISDERMEELLSKSDLGREVKKTKKAL
jgi:hypothetical protein